jgi:hypothetical protein
MQPPYRLGQGRPWPIVTAGRLISSAATVARALARALPPAQSRQQPDTRPGRLVLLEQQVGLGSDPEDMAAIIDPRHRAHPPGSQQLDQVLVSGVLVGAHHFPGHDVLNGAAHPTLLVWQRGESNPPERLSRRRASCRVPAGMFTGTLPLLP